MNELILEIEILAPTSDADRIYDIYHAGVTDGGNCVLTMGQKVLEEAGF